MISNTWANPMLFNSRLIQLPVTIILYICVNADRNSCRIICLDNHIAAHFRNNKMSHVISIFLPIRRFCLNLPWCSVLGVDIITHVWSICNITTIGTLTFVNRTVCRCMRSPNIGGCKLCPLTIFCCCNNNPVEIIFTRFL